MMYRAEAEAHCDAAKISTLDDILLDRPQADAYCRWLELSEACDGMPQRRQFRPEQNRLSLSASMLVGVSEHLGKQKLTQRVEGRKVALAFGEGRKADLYDLYKDSFLSEMLPRWLEVALTGAVAMTESVLQDQNHSDFRFTRLILPLFEEDKSVSRLYTVFGFDPQSLAHLDGSLGVQAPRRRNPAAETTMFRDKRLFG